MAEEHENDTRAGELAIKPEYLAPTKRKADEPAGEKRDTEEQVVAVPVDGKGKRKKSGVTRGRKRYMPPPQYCKFKQDRGECTNPKCRSIHELEGPEGYLANAPEDLAHLGIECPNIQDHGFCEYGVNCRFSSTHFKVEGNPFAGPYDPDNRPVFVPSDTIFQVRKKRYPYKCEPVVKELASIKKDMVDFDTEHFVSEKLILPGSTHELTHVAFKNRRDTPRMDISDKLALAPMCTVGNLPFRAVCVGQGADITFSEMILAESVMSGQKQDVSFAQKHPTENFFGLQIAGRWPDEIAHTAEVLMAHTDAKFVDLNAACPLDLWTKKGMCAALMGSTYDISRTLCSLTATVDVPVSVKVRVHGPRKPKATALGLLPLFDATGVRTVWMHGRSALQRYTKAADWTLVQDTAKAGSPMGIDVGGCGDILTYADYCHVRETYPEVTGTMLGRGALYKPWLFREIKEHHPIDISSGERLDLIRQFVSHGLAHWGSDSVGVEKTRHYLLEWLSFACRYVPLGILTQPQAMNLRAPEYIGRDDLETLMGSHRASDWVKISEMVLGKVPEGYTFEPKHRSSAY
ncbi:tRNA-dihydrouridine synthase [Carpediemonas membranifera]|uniref:tRNA-dihydrouridine(47) synthase [NAD(P)(+)] n=1 Tax=Carpediemonas membranifera TaxID=201153 RepID=A0A8J6AVH6_9EUKA|nr:tRNA-dihydrouridine synthase [Carpediemonas membranifera]|eukprot:KAG9393545.1 tRNA-dihydrouridine synthase [Carpediemonas membranifera]